MPAPFSILALDLHNTIYDEVMEYGLAISEAMNVWMDVAKRQGVKLTTDVVHRELATAHKSLGSDWDKRVWEHLPSLKALQLKDAEFQETMQSAEKHRSDKSRALMQAGLYAGVRETLAALKTRGVRIFMVTEAASDIAMQAAAWLGLQGLVDGIYSYPSARAPVSISGIAHAVFPPAPGGGHLKKPHPYLLATLILSEAIRTGEIPSGMPIEELFSLEESDGSLHEQARRLTLKDTSYSEILRRIQHTILYVGDSKFKDGLLAHNAGIAFGFAAYGKKVKAGEEILYKQSLEVMYAVTGWEVETLKLTQESARSAAIDSIQPDYTFLDSLAEALPLFE